MRQLFVGVALLGAALMVTFAAASFLQGWAAASHMATAEPFVVEKIVPASTFTRAARTEPGRSVVLASSRRVEM
jgi:hypothetical protein